MNSIYKLLNEIGHILGLRHVPNNRNALMFRGANGVDLSKDEIIKAREMGNFLYK